jgi:malonyl CoA-acyl carrier protein transacylase
MRSVFLFGGLGGREGPPLVELRELYGRPENVAYFAAAFSAVHDGLELLGRAAYERHLPAGLPLRDWLGGAAAPGSGHLASSIVDGVCTHIYQLCLLQPRTGRPAVAALGHSLGMYAAVVAAMGLTDRRAFIRACRASITMLVLTLVRAHEVAGDHRIDPEHAREYLTRARATTPPGPMAGISGLGLAEVRAMVDAHNRRAGAGVIEVGLVNGSRSHVLTGRPAALVELWLANEERLSRPGARWFFLSTTAPFHSSLLEPAVRRLATDGLAIGRLAGGDLRMPVYGTQPVPNLQRSTDLYLDLAWQSLCRPLDWLAVLARTVADHAPDAALYFGPGLSAQVFTRTYLRDAGHPLAQTVVSHRR